MSPLLIVESNRLRLGQRRKLNLAVLLAQEGNKILPESARVVEEQHCCIAVAAAVAAGDILLVPVVQIPCSVVPTPELPAVSAVAVAKDSPQASAVVEEVAGSAHTKLPA